MLFHVFTTALLPRKEKKYVQGVIQNFRAASGISKKGHVWCSFTHKYLKITLFGKKGTVRLGSNYWALIYFGLFLAVKYFGFQNVLYTRIKNQFVIIDRICWITIKESLNNLFLSWSIIDLSTGAISLRKVFHSVEKLGQ